MAVCLRRGVPVYPGQGSGGCRQRRGGKREKGESECAFYLKQSDCLTPPAQFIVSLLLRLPSSRAKLAKELAQTRHQLELKLVPLQESLPEGLKYQATMPLEGKSADWLKEEMERLRSMEKSDVKEGRVSGAVYHVSASLFVWNLADNCQTGRRRDQSGYHRCHGKVYRLQSSSSRRLSWCVRLSVDGTPLNVLPSGIRKMEAEIVSMCLNLFNNPHGAGTSMYNVFMLKYLADPHLSHFGRDGIHFDGLQGVQRLGSRDKGNHEAGNASRPVLERNKV